MTWQARFVTARAATGDAGAPVPGALPDRRADLKLLYLIATRRRKNREELVGRTNGWKAILNVLTVRYGARITDHL